MKSIEKIESISTHDFSGNPGMVVTKKAKYVFNQYEAKPWVRFSTTGPVRHNPVRGTLKIDLRLKRVIFKSEEAPNPFVAFLKQN
jgi:hypothetical protein